MSATIIPFPAKGRGKSVGNEEEAASKTPVSLSYPDFTPREEAMYRLAKQLILERLTAQDD